ncbi:MAG: T9SS type A sorting domain-containing protein [Paludibacteraceae bacterium]|nr:T9SS type A sorting domain-containing protein [Paludibacteraceae bacterium]
MNSYISFRSINILILWLFIVIGFSPLYGEEPCGLTSEQANETAAKNVQATIAYRLPINYKVDFYNYYKHAPYDRYFGCLRDDGAVFLMTYNDTAKQVQFLPYDPANKPQTMHAGIVQKDNMITLSFLNQTGDKASLGAEGQLVNSSTGKKASFHVFKFDVGYVGYNNTCYEYDRIWLIEKDPETGVYYNLDVEWKDANTPVLKRMNEGDYCHSFRKESSMIFVWETGTRRTVRCLSYHDGDGNLIRQDNLFPEGTVSFVTDNYTKSRQQDTAVVLSRTAALLTVPTGYDFLGWNTLADGSGQTYAEKSIYRGLPKTMVDLYALNMKWQVQYGNRHTTARFTATQTPSIYQAQVTLDPSMANGSGEVEISLLSERYPSKNTNTWGYEGDLATDGSDNLFTAGANAATIRVNNTLPCTLQLDLSDPNHPRLRFLLPYVLNVYDEADGNGLWAFEKQNNGRWTISDFTLPASIDNTTPHLWVGKGKQENGISQGWSFGWLPITAQGCDERTVGSAEGARGTLSIDTTSARPNYDLRFAPVGYSLIYDKVTLNDSGYFLPFTEKRAGIWETEMITDLPSTAGKNYRIHLNKQAGPGSIEQTVAAYRTEEGVEKGVSENTAMEQMPQKSSATTFNADNLAANYAGRAGIFRLEETSCEGNMHTHFVPYIFTCILPNANNINYENNATYLSLEDPVFEAPECPWEQKGYVFKNWDTDPNGMGLTVNAGETVQLNESKIKQLTGNDSLRLRFYAQWLKRDTITLHRNLNANDTQTQLQYTVETQVSTIDSCTVWKNDKPDSAIIGWSLEPQGKTLYNAGGQVITMGKNIDLYAVWEQTCTVTYHENMGATSKTRQEQGFIYRDFTLRRFQEFRKDSPSWSHIADNMQFRGWATDPEGTQVFYEDGAQLRLSGNITLYAQWDKTYTIRYFANGSVSTKDSVITATARSGQAYTLVGYFNNWNPKNASYYFIGWATDYTQAKNKQVTYSNKQTIYPKGNIDLIAVWRTPAIGDTLFIRQWFPSSIADGRTSHVIAEDNNSTVSDMEKGFTTSTIDKKKHDIWIVERNNASQFFLKNYITGHYLCRRSDGSLYIEAESGTRTVWNLDESYRIYYQGTDGKHYLNYDTQGSQWTTISTVPTGTIDLVTGSIGKKEYLSENTLATSDKESYLIYDTLTTREIEGKAYPLPALVYKNDNSGHQDLTLYFNKKYEERFYIHDQAGDWNQLIVDNPSEIGSFSVTTRFPTQSAFTLKQTSAVKSSTTQGKVVISVTPKDVPLENYKVQGKYADYVDSILCTVSVDTIRYTRREALIRRTSYLLDNDKVTLWCKKAGSDDVLHSVHFGYNQTDTTYKGIVGGHHHRQWERYYAYNNTLIAPIGDPLKDHALVVNLNNTDSFTVQTVDNATGAPATWLRIRLNKDTIHLQATEENTLGFDRAARLIITNFHQDQENGGGELMTSLSIPVTQSSRFTDTNGDLLVRNKGIANKEYDERGLQQVHTQEQTLYYIPGADEFIYLHPRERHMSGWQLWYDYDKLTRIPDSIASFPDDYICYKGTNNKAETLHIIGSGEFSQGIYGTAWVATTVDKDTLSPVARVRLSIPSDWTGVHRFAGEFSNYADYGTNFNTQVRDTIWNEEHTKYTLSYYIYEPTLSYRQIWTLIHADSMAAKMETCHGADGQWLEDYNLIAPAEQGVTLTKEYHAHHYSYKSQLCYIYKDEKGFHRVGDTTDVNNTMKVHRIVQVGDTYYEIDPSNATEYSWDKENDYLHILPLSQGDYNYDGTHPVKITHMLCAYPDGLSIEQGIEQGYKIVRWQVTFMPQSQVGPWAEDESGVALISDKKIQEHYIVLSKQDFDFDKHDQESLTYYTTPLSWEESSSGFYYPASCGISSVRYCRPTGYPHRGEYALLNTTQSMGEKNYFATFENRSGLTEGYMLMTDAPSTPGLMTMLNVDRRLCSGQKMFCSAWVGNLNNNGRDYPPYANPSLKFEIRGRYTDESEWHGVTEFMTGEIERNITIDENDYQIGTWYQINFEIDLTKDYDHYQIAVYDFAPTGMGNDFVLDDIVIYANEVPLDAYQASTDCSATSVKAIVRLDYEASKEDISGDTLYYQIWDNTGSTAVNVFPAYCTANEKTPSNDHGTVAIPQRNTPPNGAIFSSLSELMQRYNDDKEQYQAWEEGSKEGDAPGVTCMGFVKEYVSNIDDPEQKETRWILYIVHEAEMTAAQDYEVRVAYSAEDLSSTVCALRSPLPVSNAFQLAIDGEPQANFEPTTCGNEEFNLSVNVNMVAIDPATGNQVTHTGKAMNDWLLLTNSAATEEDNFKLNTWRSKALHPDSTNGHGYFFKEIENALVYDLRRESESNPNRFVTELAAIDIQSFSDKKDYQIIYDLCMSGELLLGNLNTSIYIRPGNRIRYAVMPIVGSVYDEKGNPIDMCYTHSIVNIAAPEAPERTLDIGKTPSNQLPEQLLDKPARIRLSKEQAGTQTIALPMHERKGVILPDTITLASSTDPNFNPDKHWFAYEPDKKYDFSGGTTIPYYKETDDTCYLTPVAAALCPEGKTLFTPRAGYEYTFRIPLISLKGTSSDSENTCPVGTSYFTLAITPDYLLWTPQRNSQNRWQDDANWTAVDAMGQVIYGAKGMVPQAHSSVIIPVLPHDSLYPIVSTTPDSINRYDLFYQPASCHAVYFQSGAKLGQQQLLDYQKAFADITLTAQQWYIVSTPIQETFSGDMAFYIDGSDSQPFAPKSGETNRTYNTSYISTYSHSYKNFNPEGGTFNNPEATVASTGWSNVLNTLAEPLKTGKAFSMMLWRGDDAATDATIRLPRPDNAYYYYYENGTQSPYYENIPRDMANIGKLAFTPEADETMQITLTDTTASEYFAFGNPTMAYIDMRKLLAENTNLSNTFYYKNGDAWSPLSTSMEAYGVLTPSETKNFFLAPTEGVMLRTADGTKKKELTITLSADMLSIQPAATTPAQSSKPARVQAKGQSSALLTLTAATPFRYDGTYRSTVRVAEHTMASNEIVDGEDLLLMASNAGTEEDGYFTTPLNLYVLDRQHALSVDLRQQLTCLPLLFQYGNGYTPEQTTRLQVNITGQFAAPVYLCDTLNHTATLLHDGMYIDIETPQANTLRYYLLSQEESGDNPTEPEVPTDMNDTDAAETDLDVQLVYGNQAVSLLCNYPMQQVCAYDLAGRMIQSRLVGNAHTATLPLQAGAYIIDITTSKGTRTCKVMLQ